MTNIFLTAVRGILSTVDASLTRVILLAWISTLQAQRRFGRETPHGRACFHRKPVVN